MAVRKTPNSRRSSTGTPSNHKESCQSRPPLERMIRLHGLLQDGKFPNCQTLARELEVSAKTIQRDIEFMRDRQGMPIEYEQARFGYHYTKPVSHFPGVEISEGEVVALFIAQMALEQHQGTTFEKPLRAACRKISESLKGCITVNWQDLDKAVSFRQAGVSRAELAVFESVSRGVIESKVITFEYQKLGRKEPELRRVQPYHLGCMENQWYCIAHDLEREELRTFALPRMQGVKVTPERFKRPSSFSVQQHFEGSFGVFRGGGEKEFSIRIRFDAFAARLVGERDWHKSQEIVPLDDGEIEFRLKLHSLEEIERWVLSWGTHATVIAPQALRERLEVAARHILAAAPVDGGKKPKRVRD